MKRTVRVYANVALMVTSVIAGILLGELGYRLAGYTVAIRLPAPSLLPRFYYKADPVNGFDIVENFAGGSFEFPEYIRSYGAPFSVTSNSLGCRDRPFDQEDGYVLLIGDSHTWGYVPLEQTWGATLEQLIGIRVLKCGVGGYGSRQEQHKLEAVVAKAGRPRLVVVGYCVGNDLLDDYLYPSRTVIDGYLVTKVALTDAKRGDRKIYSEDELQSRLRSRLEERLRSALEQKSAGFMAGAKDFLADHSVLYDLLQNSGAIRRLAARFGMADPPPPNDWDGSYSIPYTLASSSPWLDQAWEEHLTNLRRLKSAVEAVGATMLVVMIPNGYQVYEFLRPQDHSLEWEYPNKRLAEFFQREDIAFLDLLPELRRHSRHDGKPVLDAQEDLYWPQDGHMNVKGNRLAGLLIGRQVLEQPFLELPDKDKRLSEVKQHLSASIEQQAREF